MLANTFRQKALWICSYLCSLVWLPPRSRCRIDLGWQKTMCPYLLNYYRSSEGPWWPCFQLSWLIFKKMEYGVLSVWLLSLSVVSLRLVLVHAAVVHLLQFRNMPQFKDVSVVFWHKYASLLCPVPRCGIAPSLGKQEFNSARWHYPVIQHDSPITLQQEMRIPVALPFLKALSYSQCH